MNLFIAYGLYQEFGTKRYIGPSINTLSLPHLSAVCGCQLTLSGKSSRAGQGRLNSFRQYNDCIEHPTKNSLRPQGLGLMTKVMYLTHVLHHNLGFQEVKARRSMWVEEELCPIQQISIWCLARNHGHYSLSTGTMYYRISNKSIILKPCPEWVSQCQQHNNKAWIGSKTRRPNNLPYNTLFK